MVNIALVYINVIRLKLCFSFQKPPVRLCLRTARLTSGLWKVGGWWWVSAYLKWTAKASPVITFIPFSAVLSRSSVFLGRPVWSRTDYITQHSQLHANLARGRLKCLFASLLWLKFEPWTPRCEKPHVPPAFWDLRKALSANPILWALTRAQWALVCTLVSTR